MLEGQVYDETFYDFHTRVFMKPTFCRFSFIRSLFPVFGIFAFFFLVYALGAQRGLSWQDSGEFQLRAFTADYTWYHGIARAHPLYVALTRGFMWLFPYTSAAYAVTLASGFSMSVALALLFALVRRLAKGRACPALLATVVLGFCHMPWWMSCMAEVYTFSLMLLMGELYALFRVRDSPRWMALAFFLNGLHLAVHDFALLDLAVLGTYLFWLALRERRPALLFACAATWTVGAIPVLALVVDTCLAEGLAGAVKSLLFGSIYQDSVTGAGGMKLQLTAANFALAAVSFANPVWLLIFKRNSRKDSSLDPVFLDTPFRNALLAWTAVHFLFWVRYFVPDQATFLLPTLGLLAIWTGIGAARLEQNRFYLLQLVALSVLFSVFVPLVLSKALTLHDFGMTRIRALPFRSEFAYWLLPWKAGEDSCERFVRSVCRQLGKGDLLFADSTPAAPLLAAQTQGRLSSAVRIITPHEQLSPERMRAEMADARRVYVVSPKPGYAVGEEILLRGGYRFVKEGVLYRVTGK